MTLLLCLFLLSSPAWTENIKLLSLKDFSTQRVQVNPQGPRVMVVFQKDCLPCKQQIKDLRCIDGIAKVLLIGLFSTETELREEYRNLNTPHPGLYGDLEFIKRFNIRSPLTPQIILSKGKKHRVIPGKISCSKIKHIIEKV